jgi:hypothetical protein
LIRHNQCGPGSSNGKTRALGALDGGSIPPPGTAEWCAMAEPERPRATLLSHRLSLGTKGLPDA